MVQTRYSTPARVLHWLMAVLILLTVAAIDLLCGVLRRRVIGGRAA